MKFVALLATAALAFASGCSSNPSARDEAIINLAITYAVDKYQEERPGSGERIVAVVTGVKALIDGDASATLLTLQEYVNQELDKMSLSAADRGLANGLVSLVVAELQSKVADGVIPVDKRIQVSKFLDVVIAAARS